MKVTIHGPNLRDQSKGQFHVHTADCADNGKYGPRRPNGGEDNGWTVEASSRLEVCAAIYADHLSDYGLDADHPEGQSMLDDWLSDFHFAPCIGALLD